MVNSNTISITTRWIFHSTIEVANWAQIKTINRSDKLQWCNVLIILATYQRRAEWTLYQTQTSAWACAGRKLNSCRRFISLFCINYFVYLSRRLIQDGKTNCRTHRAICTIYKSIARQRARPAWYVVTAFMMALQFELSGWGKFTGKNPTKILESILNCQTLCVIEPYSNIAFSFSNVLI